MNNNPYLATAMLILTCAFMHEGYVNPHPAKLAYFFLSSLAAWVVVKAIRP